ncbi:MAG: ATP-binding cassette domain-containing protein [Methanoregula sp.]|nr:ATP-binding cassette domain-containing protein [Methanoregula sp.]
MLKVDLHKQLRDFSLDLNLRVNPGEILVLMGENGAGKSTVLNNIAGLLKPDTGSITLSGRQFFDSMNEINLPVEDRNIGYVLQNPAVFPHLTVRENIAYGLKTRHKAKDLVDTRVNHWLMVMNIEELARVKAGNLSGGQKQKVALARAFAIEPDLLMLDEPFTALDKKSRESVQEAVRTCVSDLQIPCLVVTHRVADALDIGERVYLLNRGVNHWEGRPSDMPAAGMQLPI